MRKKQSLRNLNKNYSKNVNNSKIKDLEKN